MTDRMDIDALLIGALYGELTPADEARLTAHLESHPADRTALSDLTRTRAQIHESRVLAFRAEPPQAVSALLLQEAARRAPRRQRESEGWFQRLARSLMAHPGLATAATLVVVVSVAGTLYLRNGDRLAASSARDVAYETAPTGAAAEAPVVQAPAAAPAVAAEPPAPPASPVAEGRRGEGGEGGAAMGAAAGSGAYGVGLADTERGADRARVADKKSAKGDAVISRDLAKQAPSDDDLNGFATKPAPAKELKAQKRAAGIEVLTPEPSPKELEKTKRVGGKLDVADRRADEPAAPSDNLAQAPAAPAASPPPPPPQPKTGSAPPKPQAVQPAADPSAGLRSSPSKLGNANISNSGTASNVPGNAGPRLDGNKVSKNVPARKPAPGAASPSPQPSAGAPPPRQQADQLLADEQDADSKDRAGDTAWARNKREQVIALVKSSNCRAAANAAMEIYDRAPAYYANNVATDRSIKPCFAYLDSERRK
ncbi:MAG: anti-sigma factor family protein, partial [bacterium]